MTNALKPYFAGEKLYGDDFTADQIQQWFADEAEGYAGLGAKDRAQYSYSYHALNERHAFRHIRNRQFANALGIGSAYGDEFMPIAHQLKHVTILDPSDAFANVNQILGVPCRYEKPQPSGNMAFADQTFDLMVSLGVMHHIPNVTHVLRECQRCLMPGGVMLLREPITSMGDWRKPRRGLTKRERGIPLHLLDSIVKEAGFTKVHRALCNFPVIPKLANKFGKVAYNSPPLSAVDALLSSLLSWNVRYHRTSIAQKLGPASVFYVLSK